MASPMTDTQIRNCTDVDELWSDFLEARRRGDDAQAELLRRRMAELQEQRAVEELDDDQLLAQIEHLERSRDDGGDVDLTASPPNSVARLSILLDEAARREL